MATKFENYTSKTNPEDALAIQIDGWKVTDVSAKTAEHFQSS
jgi:hypothetical protein